MRLRQVSASASAFFAPPGRAWLVSGSLNSLRQVGNVRNIPFALGRLARIRCAQRSYTEAKRLLM
jgi:hypothetical protein